MNERKAENRHDRRRREKARLEGTLEAADEIATSTRIIDNPRNRMDYVVVINGGFVDGRIVGEEVCCTDDGSYALQVYHDQTGGEPVFVEGQTPHYVDHGALNGGIVREKVSNGRSADLVIRSKNVKLFALNSLGFLYEWNNTSWTWDIMKADINRHNIDAVIEYRKARAITETGQDTRLQKYNVAGLSFNGVSYDSIVIDNPIAVTGTTYETIEELVDEDDD